MPNTLNVTSDLVYIVCSGLSVAVLMVNMLVLESSLVCLQQACLLHGSIQMFSLADFFVFQDNPYIFFFFFSILFLSHHHFHILVFLILK